MSSETLASRLPSDRNATPHTCISQASRTLPTNKDDSECGGHYSAPSAAYHTGRIGQNRRCEQEAGNSWRSYILRDRCLHPPPQEQVAQNSRLVRRLCAILPPVQSLTWSVWSDTVCAHVLVCRSHSLILLSLPPEAKAVPSGWTDTDNTHDLWPAASRWRLV